MKRLWIIIFAFTVSTMALFAQQSATEIPVLEPTFKIADIYFAKSTLDNVEITGNEVEAFLDIKKTLQKFLDQAKEKNLTVDDDLKVKIELPRAQNLIAFLGRAKISGRMAMQYKRFTDSLVEASKKFQQNK